MNRVGLIVFGDFIAFWISFLIILFIRFGESSYQTAISLHLVPFTILYLSWALVFYIFGLYDLFTTKPTIPFLKRWILAILSSFAIGIILFYFIPIFGISPKMNLVLQVLGFGLFSFLFRRMTYTLFSTTITQPAILVGDSLYLTELEKTISTNPQTGLKVINHFKSINEIKLKSDTKDLIIILDKNLKTLDQNILNFYKQGAEIIDTAKAYEKYLYKIPVEYIDLSFIVENINIKKDIFYRIATSTVNTVFSILILIIFSPFLIISSIFIYLYDKGPILYTQERIGINGKIFKLYKLRSMILDSEKDGAVWSSGPVDPRITPVGRIIRKLHIDEIPQMINILKGDISLVGPRPERPNFVDLLNKEIPYYSFRHVIHPGFTGWAQIKYRYARTKEDSKEKFEYDLYYIKNRNIFIDFGIIVRTIQIIFTH